MRFNPFTVDLDFTQTQKQALEVFLGIPSRWASIFEFLIQPVTSADINFLDSLATMDVAYLAQPFVSGPSKTSIDLQTMDYAYMGQPFVTYRKAA